MGTLYLWLVYLRCFVRIFQFPTGVEWLLSPLAQSNSYLFPLPSNAISTCRFKSTTMDFCDAISSGYTSRRLPFFELIELCYLAYSSEGLSLLTANKHQVLRINVISTGPLNIAAYCVSLKQCQKRQDVVPRSKTHFPNDRNVSWSLFLNVRYRLIQISGYGFLRPVLSSELSVGLGHGPHRFGSPNHACDVILGESKCLNGGIAHQVISAEKHAYEHS